MVINFVVSGTSLLVTLNGEQLPPYNLYTQTPQSTTTATTVSFLFADGRFINNIPFASVQFAGVPFAGTKSQLDIQLGTTFTPAGGSGITGSTTANDLEFTDYTKGPILYTSDGTKGRLTFVKDSDNALTINISAPL